MVSEKINDSQAGLGTGSWTCCNAALLGHLETLKWARYNGCDWDYKTCCFAASGGHLETLKWARDSLHLRKRL